MIKKKLQHIWSNSIHPALKVDDEEIFMSEIIDRNVSHLKGIKPGDIVAIIGDFNAITLSNLLELIDRGCTVVPLTIETAELHDYYISEAKASWIVAGNQVSYRQGGVLNELQNQLVASLTPGLILFTSGTTGKPKAILHDLSKFLKRFETPRASLTTLNFLLFDHIGGLNTFLHTVFNNGTVIAIKDRSVEGVLRAIKKFNISVLPTTPTFLRMLLLSDVDLSELNKQLKIVTYGTERMDQNTLDLLCEKMPDVDFRQTFGMSELGIVRVKSLARNSLFMKIGGEGIETKIENGALLIRSKTRMVGYLNAECPFDDNDWYDTGDIVESHETFQDYLKVVGRKNEIINVGGLKFSAGYVEEIILSHPQVKHCKVSAATNPISGQHVEATLELNEGSDLDKESIKSYLKGKMERYMVPRRIKIEKININHRFKRM